VTGDEAIEAARFRKLVRIDELAEAVPGRRHPWAGASGTISELLGPRWYTRGEERAILEMHPGGPFTVARLAVLKLNPGS
jgi:hypothetical protein